jgi:GntR family transcriptional regulator
MEKFYRVQDVRMLDSNSPIPLYHQLKAFIVEQIASGAWKPGDRVPSENSLGTQFLVSRTTVRQALGDLVNQGLLSRAQGRGTFVSQPRIQQPLSRLTGFSQDMLARRQQPSSRLISMESIQAPASVAAALGLTPDQHILMLRRLRLANDVPMAIECSYLSFPGCERLLQEDLTHQSLYQTLSQKLNIHPSRATQEMEAVACPSEEARYLGIRKGSPVLHMLRTTFDQHGRPFEQNESFYRGDRYIFYTELTI